MPMPHQRCSPAHRAVAAHVHRGLRLLHPSSPRQRRCVRPLICLRTPSLRCESRPQSSPVHSTSRRHGERREKYKPRLLRSACTNRTKVQQQRRRVQTRLRCTELPPGPARRNAQSPPPHPRPALPHACATPRSASRWPPRLVLSDGQPRPLARRIVRVVIQTAKDALVELVQNACSERVCGWCAAS